ncbi:MAG: RDD family protein [Flavobacterium sp.]|uniref:RDD family protein n=1 Tax=Flavobacterium sp. TaxID=239 RepID=UPI0011F50713|nr:RDD family protein [Flavobacterium sp.]RZJ66580.1 MAG: RDD family protein [Flavobacterium sp.]
MLHFEIGPEEQATKGQRFANYRIDYFAFFALIFILMFIVGFVSMAMGSDAFNQWAVTGGVLLNLVSIFLYLVYYFVFEAITGRTLGKFITGTMVINEDGEKPTTRDALIRTLCRLIPFEAFSFFGERGWHDSISKTYVVRKHIYITRKNQVLEFDEIGKDSEVI